MEKDVQGFTRSEADRNANASRIVLLLDVSPTMGTRTRDGRTRWAHAVDAALDVIRDAPGPVLVLDTVIYMLLTLYFDAVLPSEWGTHENPCFCFVNPWRWFQRRRAHRAANRDHRERRAAGCPAWGCREENRSRCAP